MKIKADKAVHSYRDALVLKKKTNFLDTEVETATLLI